MTRHHDAGRSDEALLAEFVRGRRAALGELAGRYETSLLGLAAGLLGGRSPLACDAVQETWVRVIRFADSFDGRSSFKTWLYRIAINQCRNLRSARAAMPDGDGAREDGGVGDGGGDGGAGGAADELRPTVSDNAAKSNRNSRTARRSRSTTNARSEPQPSEAAERNEALAGLQTAVDQLGEDRREVILLCYHEGLTHPQAAEILRIPLGTLKSRLHAALTDLRDQLGPAPQK